MRSRPSGSPLSNSLVLAMWVVFGPAAIALLPGHMMWRRALPIEGATGRLLSDFMVQYLNLPGACIVVGLMVALSLYLATTFTFNTARERATVRFSFVQSLWERWVRTRRRERGEAAVGAENYGSKRQQSTRKAR